MAYSAADAIKMTAIMEEQLIAGRLYTIAPVIILTCKRVAPVAMVAVRLAGWSALALVPEAVAVLFLRVAPIQTATSIVVVAIIMVPM